tara:strand:- start:830 stop:1525 length:696 start_codon:yes stop_codon:yes gene_type:complete
MYKERASQIGKIMTNARKKDEVLGGTAKTQVQQTLIKDLYGIRKEFWSKQMDKGNICEDDSIELYARVNGFFDLKKNEESFENDFFTGTPDLLHEDYVIDIKTSWDGTTFPWFAEEIPTKDYFYQLQAYMDLTGKRKAILAYCLTDAPEDMMQDEIRRQGWQHKMIEITEEFEEKVRGQMCFGQIPDDLRIKTFHFEYDEDVIIKMKERVVYCRAYYEELITALANKKINK